jgi:hypothetical protein
MFIASSKNNNMEKTNKLTGKILLIGLLVLSLRSYSQDPNFYIYLCFGQSNMEGQATIEDQDKTVDGRFQVFQALDCPNLGRTKENWYPAIPPLCQCWSGLTPADYFGRTMIGNLPDSIRVGVVNVSVGGCDIRLFDKDIYEEYDSTSLEDWFLDKLIAYEGNPYQYLMNLAKLAQEDGVIKGILLHQGETNTGDAQWPSYVKKVYTDMLTDLTLDADSVPLLAGEVLSADGNCCSSMNTIINRLHDTIPTAYVISSSGCTAQDEAHFNSAGYRELGRRYAIKMLELLGYEVNYGEGTHSVYLESECATVGEDWVILEDAGASNEGYVSVKPGVESVTEAPSGDASVVYLPFSLNLAGNYSLFARVKCTNSSSDAFWVKLDDGPFEQIHFLRTIPWGWKQLMNADLVSGEHMLTIAYCEEGAKLDKINISNFPYAPGEMGEEAENVCEPQFTVLESIGNDTFHRYVLTQNYPNPFQQNTSISFQTPDRTYVSLKVYNILGVEIAELCGKEYPSGNHTVIFEAEQLSDGNYYYRIQTDHFSAIRKMNLQSK